MSAIMNWIVDAEGMKSNINYQLRAIESYVAPMNVTVSKNIKFKVE